MNLRTRLEKISGTWRFLILICIVYFFLLIFNPGIFFLSLNFFNKIILKIIPIFIFVFILMTLSNYFITPEVVVKHLKEKGVKKWFFVIIGGILSSGPIYMWYPLLADLKSKGLSQGLIACFLYNRAIKIPVLPIAILYFSWRYILILSLVMIFMSVVQGLIINHLTKAQNENCHSI